MCRLLSKCEDSFKLQLNFGRGIEDPGFMQTVPELQGGAVILYQDRPFSSTRHGVLLHRKRPTKPSVLFVVRVKIVKIVKISRRRLLGVRCFSSSSGSLGLDDDIPFSNVESGRLDAKMSHRANEVDRLAPLPQDKNEGK